MQETHLRQAATWLLRFAIRIAPQDTLDWGQAMLGELDHVEGHRAALRWALGGVSVLAKHALVSLIIPSRRRQAILLHGELFGKEVSMRKATAPIVGVSVVAFLLLLLAPTFRTALGVTVRSWLEVFGWGAGSEGALLKLAAKARTAHDPEAVAFAAMRLWHDPAESNRLAEEAVHLNPRLTWVYSMFGNASHQPPDAETRIRELEAWDPQNAFPYLVEAQRISDRHCMEDHYQHCGAEIMLLLKNDARWFEVMAAAFRAERYDSYVARRLDMDRAVMRRYRIDDPFLVAFEYLPVVNLMDVQPYADYVLALGTKAEAEQDLREALQFYSGVARFGELMQLQGQTHWEKYLAAAIQMDAYQKMQAVAEKAGDRVGTRLLAYEIARIRQERQQRTEDSQELRDSYQWGAVSVQVSLLVVLLAGCALFVWAVWKVFETRLPRLQGNPWQASLSVAGALGGLGLFAGALTLYVSWLPYAATFDRFMAASGSREIRPLFDICHGYEGISEGLWRARAMGVMGFYYWSAFTAIAVAALLFVTVRGLRRRPRTA